MSRKSSSASGSSDQSSESSEQIKLDPIHELAVSGDVEGLRLEIKRDRTNLEVRTSDGMTPLIVATSNCHLQCIQLLVTSGADIDAKNNDGRTAVAIAAYQGWYDGMYYLITMGANCNLADKYGRLPVHVATYYSTESALEVLLNNISRDEMNKGDDEGMTALHWGAFHSRDGHVKLLIDRGAEVLVRDMEGKTPLHWAAQNGKLSCCEVLLSSRGSQHLVNGKDFSGKSPVHLAAAAGHLAVLERVCSVEHATVDLADNENRTPLHWAAATGHAQCVAVLLRLRADKDCKDKQAATPLMYAQQGNHARCCRLLMNHDPKDPLKTEIPSDEKISRDAMVEAMEQNQRPRSRSSTAPAIIAETDGGVTIQFSSENLPITASIPINVNNTPKDLGTTESTIDSVDTEVEEIMNGSIQTLEVMFDVDGVDGCPPTELLTVNGSHSSCDETEYSSDDESRYPPQMVLTPIPASPVPPHEMETHPEATKPPILPRFSFEGRHPLSKPSLTTTMELAPLKTKTIPEHLRLDISFTSGTSKPVDIKQPVSPVAATTESLLAPLKIMKPKQHSSHGSIMASNSSFDNTEYNKQRATPPVKPVNSVLSRKDSVESLEFNKQWSAKRGNKKPDLLLLSPTSETEPDLIRRPSREKKHSTGSMGQTSGQMFPAISSYKSSNVIQVQGSFQDQIDSKRRIKKKPVPKGRSIPEDLDATSIHSLEDMDDGSEDMYRPARYPDKRVPTKKKKVRKVMSWNA